jgi:hypothetical protein
MASEIEKRRRRRAALQTLENLGRKEEHVLLVHYSCESFYDRPEGQTPRVTSIAVRNYLSAQTVSFSIHKIAEVEGVDFSDIENNYDRLEKEMLAEFFNFLRERKTHIWVHWNMRDINYGFPALEHRFRVLSGQPEILEDSQKVDLARLLIALYGARYTGHPRLESLMKKNRMTDLNFLTGKEEADAFENKEYVKLHQSTLRKVDVFSNILGRTLDGSLKTNAGWFDIHGMNPKLWAEVAAQHWIVVLIGFAASALSIGLALANMF